MGKLINNALMWLDIYINPEAYNKPLIDAGFIAKPLKSKDLYLLFKER